MERLDRCRDVMLTVITAPAGAGKTRLVTEWLHTTQQVSGWVSLDRDEAEPGRFVAYLIEAIRSLFIVGWDAEALALGFAIAIVLAVLSIAFAARSLKGRMLK